MSSDVVVIGAGIAGLSAARVLRAQGHSVRVLDKARGVGGRMASRRIGDARFDHGAQFFTVRSSAFAAVVERAKLAGAVIEWTHGFQATPDGHPRWRGAEGMTSLCKWMATDAGIEPELGCMVADVREYPADAYVVTAPVPQSLAILSFSGLLPEPATATRLAGIAYKPTIAILATLDRAPTAMPPHGGCQFAEGDDLAFLTDNQAKGISPVPALTVHLSNDRSHEYWGRTDDDVVAFATGRVGSLLGDASIVAAQVQRWRYAGPVEVHPEPTVVWGSAPVVALAGEAFAGPKVEGAFLSGMAAAAAVDERLG
ncbi:MAG: FAD-dependent oxidoreductase [Acidimicrobiales bacterium]